jgi:predicted Zn-dependent peptidase
MYYDRFFGLDEIIQKIEDVTREDIRITAEEFFKPNSVAVTVLGNLNGLKIPRESLAF